MAQPNGSYFLTTGLISLVQILGLIIFLCFSINHVAYIFGICLVFFTIILNFFIAYHISRLIKIINKIISDISLLDANGLNTEEHEIKLYQQIKIAKDKWQQHLSTKRYIKKNKIFPENTKTGPGRFHKLFFHEVLDLENAVYSLLTDLITSRDKTISIYYKRQQFIRYLFHELRNPLNAINLATDSIQTQVIQEHKQKKKLGHLDQVFWTINHEETLELIHQQGQAMARIINDTLLLLKTEDGALKLEYEPFSLQGMISWVVETLKPNYIQKGIDLKITMPSIATYAFGYLEEPLNTFVPKVDVVGDKYKLRQVLVNLLTNAIKFTPTEGTIEIIVTISEAGSPKSKKIDVSKVVSFYQPIIIPELFTPKQGQINTHSRRPSNLIIPTNPEIIEQKELQHKRAHFTISVKDTGIGVASENRHKLFNEPYLQIYAAKNQKGNGTGLGLTISKLIVELHGGKIGYKTPISNIGSEFYFELDLELQPRSARSVSIIPRRLNPESILSNSLSPATLFQSLQSNQTPAHSSSNTGPLPSPNPETKTQGPKSRADGFSVEEQENDDSDVEKPINSLQVPNYQQINTSLSRLQEDSKINSAKILVAEDSVPNRKLLISLLKSLGYDVIGVENGQEAVDMFLDNQKLRVPLPFDLILMDGNMPIKDGITATSELRSLGLKIPIIAITGNALKEDIDNFLKAGVDDLLTKPITKNELVKRLKNYIK